MKPFHQNWIEKQHPYIHMCFILSRFTERNNEKGRSVCFTLSFKVYYLHTQWNSEIWDITKFTYNKVTSRYICSVYNNMQWKKFIRLF